MQVWFRYILAFRLGAELHRLKGLSQLFSLHCTHGSWPKADVLNLFALVYCLCLVSPWCAAVKSAALPGPTVKESGGICRWCFRLTWLQQSHAMNQNDSCLAVAGSGCCPTSLGGIAPWCEPLSYRLLIVNVNWQQWELTLLLKLTIINLISDFVISIATSVPCYFTCGNLRDGLFGRVLSLLPVIGSNTQKWSSCIVGPPSTVLEVSRINLCVTFPCPEGLLISQVSGFALKTSSKFNCWWF